MDCPHCGGPVNSRQLPPLEHPAFDDAWHEIVLESGERRRVPMWRLLTILRQRYQRIVPIDFLARETAKDPIDGGSISSMRVQLRRLRQCLAGTPFAIVGIYGEGYGLWPRDEVKIHVDQRGYARTKPNGAMRALPRGNGRAGRAAAAAVV